MFKNIFYILVTLTFFSCVKDIDVEQTDDVAPSPVVEANFIFFTLAIDDFRESTTPLAPLQAIDTTEVRFLNDDFGKDNIVQVDYFFRVNNTFPVPLHADFTFLSPENEPFFNINFPITPSANGSPALTEFTRVITGEEINQLTLNDKVVVTITIDTSNPSLVGELNFQSKATYFLEFSDL